MGSFLGIQVSILLFPKRNVVKFPEGQVNLPGLLKKIDKTELACSVRKIWLEEFSVTPLYLTLGYLDIRCGSASFLSWLWLLLLLPLLLLAELVRIGPLLLVCIWA